MTDETKRIGARIRVSLLDELQKAGYDSPTEAIQKGLELLVHETSSSVPCETTNDKCETTNDSCETSDDRCGTSEYKKEFESIHAENRLLNDHITTLKKELEDIKNMHTNYMMQVQTLINQKAIEAPGTKKPWWRFW
jgi:chromosome segregation ATPase